MTATNEEQPEAGKTRTIEACPFCGGRIRAKYGGLRDRLETTHATFSVYECVGCQAGVLNPAPVGDVSAFYPTNYLSGEARGSARPRGFDLEKWYRYSQYRYDFKLLERATGARIGEAASYLDLGCGSGERVIYAGALGCPRAVGVDKFDFAKSEARQDAEIVNSDILEFTPSERFRAASLFHVLEHLDDPRSVLAHIKDKILGPGGHLIIQVPNYGSLERRWFKGRWFGLDVPRHYWHFNEEAMRLLLEAHGYKVEALYQSNAALHPVTIVPSIFRDVDVQRIWVNRSRGDGYKRGMKILWAGLTVLTIPLCVIENLLGRGSMLTVVASTS